MSADLRHSARLGDKYSHAAPSHHDNEPPEESMLPAGLAEAVYMAIPMIVRYGENNQFYVNPNAGFASVMQYIREKLVAIGISEADHIELCDEQGKLLNQDDFPAMMFMTSFIKPGSEEATFIPTKVERDEHKKVTKIDVLLKDPEHTMPEIYNKLKKEYHIHALDLKAKRKEKAEAVPVPSSPSPSTKGRGLTSVPQSGESLIVTKATSKPATRYSKERPREERSLSQTLTTKTKP